MKQHNTVEDTGARLSAIVSQLSTSRSVALTGLPHPTSEAFFITTLPAIQDRVVFWLLKGEDIVRMQRLLIQWHTIHKIARPIWLLEEINPLRAMRLAQKKPQIILVDVSRMGDKIPSLANGNTNKLTINVNQQWTPSQLSQKCISLGYEFTSHASQPGYFARHGGIVEIYPINTDKPYRIEFEDNDLRTITAFDPVSKRAVAETQELTLVAQKFSQATSRTDIVGYWQSLDNPLIIHHENEEIKEAQPEWKKYVRQLEQYQRIIIHDFDKQAHTIAMASAPFYRQDFNALVEEMKKKAKAGWQLAIATKQQKKIEQLLKEKKAGSLEINFWEFIHYFEGFLYRPEKLLFLTDREIFGEDAIRDEAPRHQVDQAFIMGLKSGDYVVHLDHGIGRFIKMTTNEVEGVIKEYFVLQYAEGDKLYVPVETADKISKYIGIAHPKLHRLSGSQWYQLTRKVKQEAKLLAHELLKIYARREMIRVKPFAKDTAEEKELAKTFPYQETPDQAKAINAVKADLQKETPMDRLICGDVGFGKTEVAVRATLKAVMNKKQVALLSPTTILTQQHYDTFKERLKKFSVTIGILSRFESDKEQEAVLDQLKSGTVDIVIGTHRLLSADVTFRNLGLIIIDEEQRFGVKAKERLKKMRTQAHVLTMTATPIPRTLNIALSGVRDVSIIETPPEGRLPIVTEIEPYSEKQIATAITEELARDGQIYYLHNKVETIQLAAKKIQELVPEARIGIAHGRLPEKNLAKAMNDFDTKKTNVLACSTIIENGLDLPNVNTMIVDHATDFGLAQLYQLRGRIGRGKRQAYAYFLYHRKKLKGNAKKRLQALMEAKKLGSGFQLALRDLEIRGAGNILGKEQHGKVSAIGLSLYTRLLAQAIEELKYGKVQEPIRDIIIDLPLEAYIPTNYLPEEERLALYQKLAGIVTMDELNKLKQKIYRARTKEDQRHIPQELLNLFEVLEVRLLAQKTDISNIDTSLITDESGNRKRRLIIKFLFPLKPEQLARLLQKNPEWQFSDDLIKIDLAKLGDNWLPELKKILAIFSNNTKKKTA